jgi:predicted HicB family RNase H-like nuclease
MPLPEDKLTVYVPRELTLAAKAAARKADISVSQVVRAALREFVARVEGEDTQREGCQDSSG